MGFYGSWGIGAKYSPISWGDSFKFKPVVGLRGGFSYLDSKSILHIHVDEDHPENTYPGLDWAALNSVPIYQDIRTDAKTKGWGGFVDSYVGLLLEYLNFTFQANVGYRYEKIPTLTIGEYTVSDGKVETKHSSVKYDASGINAQVLVGYKLKF
ncbi:hypothetical protein HZC32_01365 [Candidatus Woesearchaeota archaeon]|nr:hypothetical protein [Candidatus Woesearchaeota archaeon]